jgi:hypothetical protein
MMRMVVIANGITDFTPARKEPFIGEAKPRAAFSTVFSHTTDRSTCARIHAGIPPAFVEEDASGEISLGKPARRWRKRPSQNAKGGELETSRFEFSV